MDWNAFLIDRHVKDLIILTAATQSFALISNWFWFLLLLAPIRAVWMLWGTVIQPWLSRKNEPTDERDEKKQKKLERKMKREQKFRWKLTDKLTNVVNMELKYERKFMYLIDNGIIYSSKTTVLRNVMN